MSDPTNPNVWGYALEEGAERYEGDFATFELALQEARLAAEGEAPPPEVVYIAGGRRWDPRELLEGVFDVEFFLAELDEKFFDSEHAPGWYDAGPLVEMKGTFAREELVATVRAWMGRHCEWPDVWTAIDGYVYRVKL